MRRTLVLLAIPLGLAALWWTSNAPTRESAAQVEIVTDEVLALRGAVIARVGTVGAVRVGEQTDYSGRGASTLNFRVPAARLEEALVELNQVGGHVTSQRVDLAQVADTSDALERDVADLGTCLDGLGDPVSRAEVDRAMADLGSCRRRLTTVSRALTDGDVGVSDALLRVTISPASSTNVVLIVAVALLAMALGVMAFLTLRSMREERTIDISDAESAGDFVFDRHWN